MTFEDHGPLPPNRPTIICPFVAAGSECLRFDVQASGTAGEQRDLLLHAKVVGEPRQVGEFLSVNDHEGSPGGSSGLVAMNTGLNPDGSPYLLRPHVQPFCPQPPHRPSHDICIRSRFLLLVAASQRTLRPLGRRGSISHGGHGTGFAQSLQARRSVWPNRVHDVSCDHFVTDGLFTSGSSPPRVATTQ